MGLVGPDIPPGGIQVVADNPQVRAYAGPNGAFVVVNSVSERQSNGRKA